MKKSFETEVRNLDAKVTRLEEKVEHQGLLLGETGGKPDMGYTGQVK